MIKLSILHGCSFIYIFLRHGYSWCSKTNTTSLTQFFYLHDISFILWSSLIFFFCTLRVKTYFICTKYNWKLLYDFFVTYVIFLCAWDSEDYRARKISLISRKVIHIQKKKITSIFFWMWNMTVVCILD